MLDPWKLARGLLLLVWCAQVYAASSSLGQTFGSITAADWISFVMLSGISALFALLHRVRKNFEAKALAAAGKHHDDADLTYGPWWLFAVCHVAGALFVGAVAFFIGEGLDINSYYEAVLIACCSWSGAKFADKLANGVAGSFLEKTSQIFGRSKS